MPRPHVGTRASSFWTDAKVAEALEALRASYTLEEAAQRIGVTVPALQSMCTQRRAALGGTAASFLRTSAAEKRDPMREAREVAERVVQRSAGEPYAGAARVAEPGTVMGKVRRSVARLGETKPGRYRLAHVTDLHGGSHHFDAAALLHFLKFAKSLGVCAVLDTGDNADGAKDVLVQEQRETGMDGQHAELVDVFAAAELGVPVWAISGNHDGYHDAAAGCDSGAILATRMQERGVMWHHLGQCLGRVVVHGAKLELWHGAGGSGTRNAVRRVLNHRAESYVDGDAPHVLLVGHYHRYAQFVAYPESIFCVSGGTFQRKRSEFANRIAHPWDIGGGILSFTVRDDMSVGEFAYEFFPAKVSDAMGWAA